MVSRCCRPRNDDLTVSLVESKRAEEMQTRAGSVAERIMNRLQTKNEWVTRQELNADPLVGGSVSAIQKTLQRLENRGVLEVEMKEGRKIYRALRSTRGESVWGGQVQSNPDDDSKVGVDNSSESEGCPPPDLSPGAASEDARTMSTSPRVRTEEETDGVIDQSQWD